MTEIIEFVSYETGVNEFGVQIDDVKQSHFKCFAEVPRMTVKEFSDKSTKVGNSTSAPTFYISAMTDEPVDTNWRILWNDREYQIISIDEDFQNRDMTKIKAELYAG